MTAIGVGCLLVACSPGGPDRPGSPAPVAAPSAPAEAAGWSARTSDWGIVFDGTRRSITDLARRYADYYRAARPRLLRTRSRELDTDLGANAVLYAARGDRDALDAYRGLLLEMARDGIVMEGSGDDPTVANDLFASYRFMRGKGVFTPAECQTIEDYLWGLSGAFASFRAQDSHRGRLAELAAAISDPARAAQVRKLALHGEPVIEGGLLREDDAFAYDRVHWKHAIFEARALPPRHVVGEGMRRASEDFFATWTPCGVQPGYGDGTGASLWEAITPEWIAAHALRNGAYKQIAIRALQYALDQDQLRERGAQPALWQMWDNADDDLKPVAPDLPPCIVPGEGRADKMVFRDGWDPEDGYLLWDLLGGPAGSHNHADEGAVSYLVWKKLAWVVDSNYGVRGALWHNGLLMKGARPEAIMEQPRFLHRDGVTIGTAIDASYVPGRLSWRRTIVHARGRYFAVFDSVRATTSTEINGGPQWHVRGDPVRHPGGTAIDLRQGKSTLRILSFEDLSCEAIKEPEQIDVGTGCPPESYALFWGPPFHRVAVRKRRILDAAQRAGWITLFVTGGEAKVEPAGAAPDAWPQRLVVTVPEGTDRIEIGDEILARLTRHAAGRRDTVWEIRDR